jgi:hypothetical protein
MRSDSPALPFSQTLTDPNTCSLSPLRTSLNPARRLRRLECLRWPLLVDMKRSAYKIPPFFPFKLLDFKRCLFSFFLHSLRHMRPERQNSHQDSSQMSPLSHRSFRVQWHQELGLFPRTPPPSFLRPVHKFEVPTLKFGTCSVKKSTTNSHPHWRSWNQVLDEQE